MENKTSWFGNLYISQRQSRIGKEEEKKKKTDLENINRDSELIYDSTSGLYIYVAVNAINIENNQISIIMFLYGIFSGGRFMFAFSECVRRSYRPPCCV